MPRCRTTSAALLGLLLGSIALPASAQSNQGLIVRDHTLDETSRGAVVPPGDGASYLITPELGTTKGTNLFHSFERFGVGEGEVARFVGPDSIRHLITRVTGGESSRIDGRLESSVGTADLYLVNPHGIVFGPGGTLDVPASFYATTADLVVHADGSAFSATLADDSLLGSAPPAAFGFLGARPGPSGIAVEGQLVPNVAHQLRVRPGFDLGLVADGVQVDSAELVAPGGTVRVASVAGAGALPVSPDDLSDLADFETLGDVLGLSASFKASGPAAGDVRILGNTITLRGGSLVTAITEGDGAGGELSLEAREQIQLDRSSVHGATIGPGSGASLHVAAPRILLLGEGARLLSETLPGFEASGRIGGIRVEAPELLNLDANGQIRSSAGGTATADPVVVVVGRLVQGSSEIATETKLASAGTGALLTIDADTIQLRDAGRISSYGRSTGPGGDLHVAATESITVEGAARRTAEGGLHEGFRSAIEAVTDDYGGHGGSVTIDTPDLSVVRGGMLRTRTENHGGRGGDLRVDAERLVVSQDAEISTVSLSAIGSEAGDLEIRAGTVDVQGSDVLGPLFLVRAQPTGIFSRTQASGGAGGDLRIEADELGVREGGAVSTASFSPGRGGDLALDLARLRVSGGSIVDSSSAFTGSGGGLDISARELVEVSGSDSHGVPSRIGSLTLVSGDAGDLRIEAPLLIVDGGSIATTSVGFGNLVAKSASLEDPSLRAIFEAFLGTEVSVRELIMLLTGEDVPADGDAGDVALQVGDLRVEGGGKIDASSLSGGAAGAILVIASGTVEVAGAGSEITSRPGAGGSGGGIVIHAAEVAVSEGGRISVSGRNEAIDAARFVAGGVPLLIGKLAVDISETLGPGFQPLLLVILADLGLHPFDVSLISELLSNRPRGADPDAGSVLIRAGRARLEGGRIEAGADGARGGNVRLEAERSIELLGGTVDASVRDGSGGNVDLVARDLVRLDRGSVSASVTNGSGGDVAIDPTFVVLGNGSRIVAQAGVGEGGNIEITAGHYLAEPDSVVDASAEVGVDGTVVIRSPDVDLSAQLAALPESYLDAAGLLGDACAARLAEGRASSFVIGGRDGSPAGPRDHLAAAAPLAGPAALARATPPEARIALARAPCR